MTCRGPVVNERRAAVPFFSARRELFERLYAIVFGLATSDDKPTPEIIEATDKADATIRTAADVPLSKSYQHRVTGNRSNR